MKFEKVDLFCPNCGKYSVYREVNRNGFPNGDFGCNSCLEGFEVGCYLDKMEKGFENET